MARKEIEKCPALFNAHFKPHYAESCYDIFDVRKKYRIAEGTQAQRKINLERHCLHEWVRY